MKDQTLLENIIPDSKHLKILPVRSKVKNTTYFSILLPKLLLSDISASLICRLLQIRRSGSEKAHMTSSTRIANITSMMTRIQVDHEHHIKTDNISPNTQEHIRVQESTNISTLFESQVCRLSDDRNSLRRGKKVSTVYIYTTEKKSPFCYEYILFRIVLSVCSCERHQFSS